MIDSADAALVLQTHAAQDEGIVTLTLNRGARFIADERRGFQQLADVIGLKKD